MTVGAPRRKAARGARAKPVQPVKRLVLLAGGRRAPVAPKAEEPFHEPVSPDRRLRIPLGLREQLPSGARRIGRMALPARPRLAQRLWRATRPWGRFVPVRSLQYAGATPASLRARRHGSRDDLAHADRLAAGA